MDKKRWSGAVLGMNTLVHRVGALLAVSTLLVLGTSTPVMAKCDGDGICGKGENAKNCPLDCTTTGPPPPEGALTAILSGGTFVFGVKPVVLNAIKNTATSDANVTLNRPGVGHSHLRCEWDSVFTGVDGAGCLVTMFDGCGLLVAPPEVLDFGDDWEIFFGTSTSEGGGGLPLGLRGHEEVGVDSRGNVRDVRFGLSLIGLLPDYVVHPIPPAALGISHFCLDDFILGGGTAMGGPRETCQQDQDRGSGGSLERFTLTNKSTLTICGKDVTETNCAAAAGRPVPCVEAP